MEVYKVMHMNSFIQKIGFISGIVYSSKNGCILHFTFTL